MGQPLTWAPMIAMLATTRATHAWSNIGRPISLIGAAHRKTLVARATPPHTCRFRKCEECFRASANRRIHMVVYSTSDYGHFCHEQFGADLRWRHQQTLDCPFFQQIWHPL